MLLKIRIKVINLDLTVCFRIIYSNAMKINLQLRFKKQNQYYLTNKETLNKSINRNVNLNFQIEIKY